MSTPSTVVDPKHKEMLLLLSTKPLRAWNVENVLLWLSQVNDGSFLQYTDKFRDQKINGLKLMNLNNENNIKQLGIIHQTTTFMIAISSLKRQSQKKIKRHRSHSQVNINNVNNISNNINTETRKYGKSYSKSKNDNNKKEFYTKHLKRRSTTELLFNSFRNNKNNKKNQNMRNNNQFILKITDKKILWNKHKNQEIYSGFLFKRGLINKKFQQRWCILCNENNTTCNGYLFYFKKRPTNNDIPSGYIDISTIINDGIIGSLNNNNANLYLLNNDKCDYYQFILRCIDRDWILGALDTNTYIQWITRIKNCTQKT